MSDWDSEDWAFKARQSNARYLRALLHYLNRHVAAPMPKVVKPRAPQPTRRETFIPDALQQALKVVQKETGISARAIRGPDRHRYLFFARRKVAIMAREQGCSFPQIGRALNRDHTTIMSMVGALSK